MDSVKGIATFGSGGMGRGTSVIRLKLPTFIEKTIMRILIFLIIASFTVSVGSAYFVLEKCGVDNPELENVKMRLSVGLILMSIGIVLMGLSVILENLQQNRKVLLYLGIASFIFGVVLMITIIPN